MPFGTIVLDTRSFAPLTAGLYRLSTVNFGSPSNDLRVTPAGRPNKDGSVRAAVQRVIEKDVVSTAGVTERKLLTVTISINVPSGAAIFTTAEIDAAAADLSSFVTEAVLNRMLQGES